MIAYDKYRLLNAYARAQADEALREGCIGPESHEVIYNTTEVGFYTPNYFVRIGLALLMLLIIACTGAFLALVFHEHNGQLILGFLSVACYVVAELLIRSKKHFNSGVDNMLIWASAYTMWTCIAWVMFSGNGKFDATTLFLAFLVFGIVAARFADTLMSVVASMALMSFFVHISWFWKAGFWANEINSVITAIASVLLYGTATRCMRLGSLLFYQSCFRWVRVVALVSLFGAWIFPSWVMGRFNNEPDWFAWVWLFIVPPVYILMGIRTRDILLIRMAIPLFAASIMIFRQYHHIMEPEVAMLIGGVILFIVSYRLINYLHEPKYGFTFQPDTNTLDTPQMDGIITETVMDKATGR